MTSSERSDRVRERRAAFWRGVGQVDTRRGPLGDVDEPDLWPAGTSAYLKLLTIHSGIIATDGLSNPGHVTSDHEVATTGLGLELYLEGTQLMDPEPGEIDWLLDALGEAAGALAGAGPTLGSTLAERTLLSLELSGEGAPPDWIADGRLGALIGVPLPGRAPGFDVDGDQVRALSLTPLRPSELAVVIAEGADGRRRVAEALAQEGWFSYVDTDRPAVL